MRRNDIQSYIFEHVPITLSHPIGLIKSEGVIVKEWKSRIKIAKENMTKNTDNIDYSVLKNVCGELCAAAVSKQGGRAHMEDMFICKRNILNSSNPNKRIDMYTVLDGHGTHYAALFCREHMPIILNHMLENVDLSDKNLVAETIYNFFLEVDFQLYDSGLSYFLNRGKTNSEYIRRGSRNSAIDKIGGTTCTLLLLFPTFWLSANIGDSRTLLVNLMDDQFISTNDHSPDISSEFNRIRNAGFIVSNFINDVPRIDGKMAVSRGFGDFEYKCYNSNDINKVCLFPNGNKNLYAISSTPDITIQDYKQTDSYFCLASDGFFGTRTSEQLLQMINKYFLEGEFDLSTICEKVVDIYCSKHTDDNVTLILIKRNCFD